LVAIASEPTPGWTTLHPEAPPVGSVEVAIVLFAPTATQSEVLGQDIPKSLAFPASPWSWSELHVAAPDGAGQTSETQARRQASAGRSRAGIFSPPWSIGWSVAR